MMKLAVIGGGAMGEAVIAAVLRAKLIDPASVRVAERYQDRLSFLAKTYSITAANGPAEAVEGADFALLAVKPQDFETAAGELNGHLQATVAMSIMAGVPIRTLSKLTGTDAVIRSMPNTPAQIGQGMTAWTATAAVTAVQREAAKSIFGSMGQEAYVPDEKYLDMVVALSGSGPAYVFLFIEALIDAGVHVGLARDLATQLALQTAVGSALYARDSEKSLAELRGLVTSPGGTTAAALRELEAGGFRSTLLEAVIAAYERSRELGEPH
jgi:pyrroline-5-carboxylate reductase